MHTRYIAAAWLTFWLTLPTAAQPLTTPGTIVSNGIGQTVAIPDMAIVDIRVTTNNATPVETLDANGITVSGITAALNALGVGPRDLQSQGLSVSAKYGPDGCGSTYAEKFIECKLQGYDVSVGLTARVVKLDQLGAILAAITEIDTARIQDVTFGVIDDSGRFEEAYAAALADAKHKATVTADALGVTLGRILVVRGDTVDYGENTPATLSGVPRPSSGEMADLIILPTGELTFNRRVIITYEIAAD